MRLLTYALQFRGRATPSEDGFRKTASGPGCSHVTELMPYGVEAGFIHSFSDDEATFESVLSRNAEDVFVEEGSIEFGRGHSLRFRSIGTLRFADAPDPHLRHGAALWEILEGKGQFEGARGRITSNFLISDTGELTDNHFGVIFVRDDDED